MSWRRNDLSQFSASLTWLEKKDAARVYDSASAKTSPERYGLSEQFWEITGRWNADRTNKDAGGAMLKSLLSEEFLLIFSRDDVCHISRSAFLTHWPEMFVPARDDCIIISCAEDWCLFYCHEDEFEFGLKKIPNHD